MEAKEMKIVPPEGYEIDKANSTFECIKFKPKQLTYGNVAIGLFKNKHFYYIKHDGEIGYSEHIVINSDTKYNKNNATSKKQLEKLLAINKLMNVAKYLNGNWKPDWNNKYDVKYFINIDNNELFIDWGTSCNRGIVYFKGRDLALQAIDILGEDTIRLAFSTDW